MKEIIHQTEASLKQRLDQLQLDKRHLSIDPNPFVAQVSSAVRTFSDRLDEIEKTQPDVYHDDQIRSHIDELYDGKLGKPPSFALLKTVYEEGAERYKHQVPPGYKDQSKDGKSYNYRDLNVDTQYGDLSCGTKFSRRRARRGLRT